jgi:response regulator of citrate/malate metabolism
MKKQEFNPIEKKILRLLYQSKTELTTYEVAKYAEISYPTSKKYLKELIKKGAIEKNEKEN